MRKINALLNTNNSKTNNQFNALVAQANKHLNLQQFWQAAAPLAISNLSTVGHLKNELLTIYAHNNSVAAKIKLTSASLLTQLQNLQKTDPFYKLCKVTVINVKVQVKSKQMPKSSAQRTLSRDAATTLRNLANNLGDTSLADKLNKLADNA
jgi:Dna[CI] antecedent DciA-like protein